MLAEASRNTFHPCMKFEAEGNHTELGNADCRNQSQHDYLQFSSPVTEEKSAEQLAQICIFWLITGGSQSDQ